jgi:hypothetical protein
MSGVVPAEVADAVAVVGPCRRSSSLLTGRHAHEQAFKRELFSALTEHTSADASGRFVQ